MNINIVRNRGLITELRSLTAAVNRLADLKELELNSVHRITTRTAPATTAALEDTQVGYNDPEYETLVREMERRAGRTLNAEEAAKVMALVGEEDDE